MSAIADRLNAWLALPEPDGAAVREGLRETAVELWSWEGVAKNMLAAAVGDLEGLPVPGAGS